MMPNDDKQRTEWLQQLQRQLARTRNARIGGKARRKQIGNSEGIVLYTRKKEASGNN